MWLGDFNIYAIKSMSQLRTFFIENEISLPAQAESLKFLKITAKIEMIPFVKLSTPLHRFRVFIFFNKAFVQLMDLLSQCLTAHRTLKRLLYSKS